ncbi:hypothetical protein FKW77_008951 [Venturia effusa]|uniref:Major facilitator superfamily (MFS) profile domain-containing protein n=1 Tax=Venturia effusa TaxID=50376 RepID=A0A517L7Z1_9PEZI|nr:hypothetical protein FKW77_008951 [Venturia effusa]
MPSQINRLKKILWGKDDAALLMKLDFTLLPYFSIVWFLFGLSRASYSSAYISGMKDDLGFKGKEFNYMTTTYLVVYAVCQIPGTSLLTIYSPTYVFVAANLTWSVLRQGHMAGGWIQAALLKSLDGKAGIPAWRWIFIVVGVLTIPSALFGYVFIPNMPKRQDAWYLTSIEREHAYKRLGEPRNYTWDRSVFKRVLLSWQFWLLPFIFMLYSLAIQMELNNVFQLWLASRGYSAIQQNNYPTGVYASAIIATITYSIISDKIQSRWQCSLIIGLTFVVGSAILIANPAKDAPHFFAYYLLGTTYAPQALWYAWMADVTAHDYQLRAITTGFMNSFDFAFVTWWPLIFYPVTDAPNYRKGYIASIVTGSLILPLVGLIAYLERKGKASGKLGRVAVASSEPDAGEDDQAEPNTEALHVPDKNLLR